MGSRVIRVSAWVGATTLTAGVLVVVLGAWTTVSLGRCPNREQVVRPLSRLGG